MRTLSASSSRAALVAGATGLAFNAHAQETVRAVGPPTAHIVIDAATGERLATAQGPRALRSFESPVWFQDALDPVCTTPFGDGLEYGLFALDIPPNDSYQIIDWGDIAPDTVIEAVTVSFFTDAVDIDTDGDGFGEGVHGIGLELTFYDNDNGAGASRVPIWTFTSSPISGPTTAPPPGFVSGVLVTFVFTDTPFEIGDSDGVSVPGAAFNPNVFPGSDIDNDGLADFSFGIRSTQPVGSPAQTVAFLTAGPDGPSVEDPPGVFTRMPTILSAGGENGFTAVDQAGVETTFDDDFTIDCNNGEDWKSAFIYLYNNLDLEPPCACDIEGDGDRDPDDINAFVELFTTTGFDVDGDGDSDPDDISAFVECFTGNSPECS